MTLGLRRAGATGELIAGILARCAPLIGYGSPLVEQDLAARFDTANVNVGFSRAIEGTELGSISECAGGHGAVPLRGLEFAEPAVPN